MAYLYYKCITKYHTKTIDDVPDMWKDAVLKLIEKDNQPNPDV